MRTSQAAHETEIQELTLSGIAHRCAQETELFFKRQSYDPRYCFELLRRAIEGRDEQAWGLVYAQYRPLVASWVEGNSAFGSSGEDVNYFINRAFEKMWAAVPPDRLGHFPDLKSLMRYLKMCAYSVVLDQVRAADGLEVEMQADIASVESKASSLAVEDKVLDDLQGQALWDQLEARLRSEKEHRVLYGSYVLGLKPSEIYDEAQDMFRDVKEVYRVKENLLARLRRDSELKKLFGRDD